MHFTFRSLTPLLQVFDMPASLAFYRDVLGFTIISTDDDTRSDRCDWAMLRRDGTTLMLNTAYEDHERPAAPCPERGRHHDDTGLYFACPDVDAVYQHLLANEYKVDGPKIAPYGMRQLYVHDPDGYALCFQWPAASEAQQ